MYSSVQREAIRRFADRVTPPSWHIALDPEDERIQPVPPEHLEKIVHLDPHIR